MTAGYFYAGQVGDPSIATPDEAARRRKIAEALMAEGSDTSAVGSWTQGAARLVKALVGGMHANSAAEMERKGRSSANDALIRALMGDTSIASSPPSPANSAVPRPVATSAGGGMSGGFANAVSRTLGFEGGLNPRDSNGAPSNFGINAKANPDVDVMSLTAESAKPLYKSRYWDTIGADNLPPALAHVAFDTSVIAGPGKAKELLAASGGDPARFMDMREQFLSGLVQKNPAKFGPYEKAWANRNAGLRSDLASFAPPPQQVAQSGRTTPDGLPMSPVASNAPSMSYAPAPGSNYMAAKLATTDNAQGPNEGMNIPWNVAQTGGASSPPPPNVAESPQAGTALPSANGPAMGGMVPGNQPMPQQPMAAGAGAAAPQTTASRPQAGNMMELMSAVTNPWLSESQRGVAMMALRERMASEGVTFVDAGDRLIPMNKRGQQVGQPIPKTRDGADWQLVKDNDGNPVGRFNARTGTTEPLPSTLAPAGAKAPTTRVVKQSDGSEVALQWDSKANAWVPLNAPQGGNPVAAKLPKLTEQQSKDVNFYQRGLEANKELTPDAERALLGVRDTGLENAPGVLGLRPGRALQSPEFQTAHNAARNFLAVVLRKDTGAAITTQEWSEYTPLFIPQPGDAPGLIEQKRRNRAVALQGIKDGLGNVGDVLDLVMSQRGQIAPPKGGNTGPGSGQPVRVTSPDEARKLPSGTRIILPDGSPGVVP